MKQRDLLIIDGILLSGPQNKYGGQDPVNFIPDYVKDLGSGVFLAEDVVVDDNNPYLYSENGCIYRRGIDGDTLIVFSGQFENSWDEEFFDELHIVLDHDTHQILEGSLVGVPA